MNLTVIASSKLSASDLQPAHENVGLLPHFGDLLILVEVYHSLPREALIVTLAARGFDPVVDLEQLDFPTLAALAVHTHSPDWQRVSRFMRRGRKAAQKTGPLMLDAPV